MPSKGIAFNNDLLKLIFNATSIAGIADNAVSSSLTNLYVSLHTSNPDVGGSQITNEAAYTSYARVPVARNTSGWTVTGTTVNPASAITFPTATGGTEIETFFAVGTALSGAGKILYFGSITPTIAVSNGVTPQLTTDTSITEA